MMNVDPETGIWSMSIAVKRHKFDEPLASAIYRLQPQPYQLVDIGCGSGMYCRYFAERGWPVIGIEGTVGIRELGIYSDILEADLSKPISFYPGECDLALCLEVGEHIPAKYESIFIDNVVQLAKKHLILSWAIPGQYSASGHVNCQTNEYVIEKFVKYGFEYEEAKTELLREKAQFNWFKRTLMCFRKTGGSK